ncbi:MAG: DUF3995 domain-containing protein [Flavobacteriales bacterium]|nr:DUF3995 domain-containing protein [Flavobacteriales bacterium]
MDQINYCLFNANVLAALGILHLYWLFGGRVSIEYFFPVHSRIRKKSYKPSKLRLLIVALVLFFMSLFFIEQMTSFTKIFTPYSFKWGNRILVVAFTARAFGNFTYLGFTKSFKKGKFAKLDTYLYSPLCLLMALFTYLLSLTNFV